MRGFVWTSDVTMRFANTVVLFKGEPVYFKTCDRSWDVVYRPINKRNWKEVRFDHEGWDFSPVPLGYCNTRARASYLARLPVRRWKQGLSADNCTWIGGSPGVHIRDVLTSQYLYSTIKGQFIPYKKCIQEVKSKDCAVISRAFSREWAVTKNKEGLLLMANKGKVVGWFNKGNPILGEGNEYLIQSMEEAING